MTDADAKPRSKIMRWLPVLVIVAIAVAIVASGAYRELKLETLARHYDTLQAWRDQHPVLAAGALVLALALMISSGLPGGVVITVAAGLFFGTVLGGILAATGNVIGATALYLVARRFFMTGRTPPPLVEKIRAGFDANPASYAFFIRFVPVFPFGAASVALAWLGCRLPLFVLASGIGSLPGATIYAALGAGLSKTIRERQDVELSILAQPRFAVPIVALAVLALIPAVIGMVRQRRAATVA